MPNLRSLRFLLALVAVGCPFEPADDGPVVVTGDDDDDACVAQIETCNDRDDDCDGESDEDFDKAWFVDADGDGVGDADLPGSRCEPAPGWSRTPGDCDDGDPALAGPVGDVLYVDVSAAAGVDYQQWDGTTALSCGLEPWSGGAAIGDYDLDGDLDLFVPRMHASDRLYDNRGNGTFDEVSQQEALVHAGSSSGALWVDVTGDRYLDLFVTGFGGEPDRLYVYGPTGFVDEGPVRGIDPSPAADCSSTFGVSAADVDGDDDVDLFVASWWPPGGAPTGRSRLLLNDGDGSFTDATDALGLSALRGVPLTSVVFSDFDFDQAPDLLAVGASTSLWRNRGDGRFVSAAQAGLDGFEASAATAGDLDGDGDVDWLLSGRADDAVPCPAGYACTGTRVLMAGPLGVEDVSPKEVQEGGAGFAITLFDLDGDTSPDVAQAVNDAPNGYTGVGNHLWQNLDGSLVEAACGANMVDRREGRALLPFDGDGDGDPDLLLVPNGEPPRLYQQQGGEASAWLRVELDQPGANRYALGARIAVEPVLGGPVHFGTIGANASYLSSGPPEVHLRLGALAGAIAEVRVTWPDGAQTTYTDVPTGHRILVRY